MTNQLAIEKTAKYMQVKFEGEGSGHDWWHIYRVWQLAKHIASKEKGADMLVVELAALLHDIADHKFHGGDTEIGAIETSKWLRSLKVDQQIIDQVADIVRHISFKSAKVKNQLSTLEGYIVHDADKLDAIGAIGIARVFSYGGARGRVIYNPDQPHIEPYKFEEGKQHSSSAVHHFYEKLFLLKDRMFTTTGRQMAEERHEFMEVYLEQFYKEWDGKK